MPANVNDKFQLHSPQLDSPCDGFPTLTPDDNNDIAVTPRAIYVGVDGDVTVVDRYGNTSTFKNVAAGTLLPIRPLRLKATGTTATQIVGLF